MRNKFLSIVLLLGFAVVTGCSSGSNSGVVSPVLPDVNGQGAQTGYGETLWGLYNIYIDAETQTAEVVPMRTVMLEANILKFLEGVPSGPFLTISNFVFNPPLMEFDVGLQHPFPGNTKFTGFTVRGILLTNGTQGGFEDSDLMISSEDQLRLLNYDGYTRWMNPVDFPEDGTIRCYHPGMAGDPNGEFFSSTLNPYKLFADDLGVSPDDLELDESMKAVFTSDSCNSRHYVLDFGSQPATMLQYAIVASHDMPLNIPPEIPDDFPPGTVASEPWKVEAFQLSNGLYNDGIVSGGSLIMQVQVRDFEDAENDQCFIEAPGIFPRQEMSFISQTGTLVVFEREVTDITVPPAGTFDMLIAAVAPDGEGFDGALPGAELATYIFHSVDVSPDAPPPPPDCPEFPFYDDFETTNCVWTAYGGDWWGVANGYLDAKGGGTCYEEDTGSQDHNENISYTGSPIIPVPESELDLVITIYHAIDVDPPEPLAQWAWDACFVQINGELIYPTSGPSYEDTNYPLTFDDYPCWTSTYDWMVSQFNVGTAYNGTEIEVQFVLDTFDYIDNCDPPYFGWLIDEITVDFAD